MDPIETEILSDVDYPQIFAFECVSNSNVDVIFSYLSISIFVFVFVSVSES